MKTTTFEKVRVRDLKVGDTYCKYTNDKQLRYVCDILVNKNGNTTIGCISYNSNEWIFRVNTVDNGMTVRELIKLLSKENQDDRVVIRGYEGGTNDVGGIGKVKLKLNVHDKWYYGKHEILSEDEDEEYGNSSVNAIHIHA